MWADDYSAKPWSQAFAPIRTIYPKGGSSEKLSVPMRNPCDRQLVSIHLRLQFFDSSLSVSFVEDEVPLLKEPPRQLRDVFWMLNQVANPNATHINSNVWPN
jgi:hypothetical protein